MDIYGVWHAIAWISAGWTSLALQKSLGGQTLDKVLKLQPYCLGLPLGVLENFFRPPFLALFIMII